MFEYIYMWQNDCFTCGKSLGFSELTDPVKASMDSEMDATLQVVALVVSAGGKRVQTELTSKSQWVPLLHTIKSTHQMHKKDCVYFQILQGDCLTTNSQED